MWNFVKPPNFGLKNTRASRRNLLESLFPKLVNVTTALLALGSYNLSCS
ncbi:hypothetical protein APLC1_1311 [Limnospira platensis C1]|nr:hypothetical protein APLC1_1311 [Arthrospira platensis C1]